MENIYAKFLKYINVYVEFELNSVKLYADKTEIKKIIEVGSQMSFFSYHINLVLNF